MNAPLRLFAQPLRMGAPLRLVAGAGLCALLGACAGNPFATAEVDPASPVAAEVARVARLQRDYPTFADIPPVPADQRPPAAWGQAANDLESAAAELERETAPGTWTLEGTEAFAQRARRAAGADDAPPSATAAAEAFARQARERATPPPPPR